MASKFRTGTLESIDNDHGMLTVWFKCGGKSIGLMGEQRYVADALVQCLGLDDPWEGKPIRFKGDSVGRLLAVAPVEARDALRDHFNDRITTDERRAGA